MWSSSISSSFSSIPSPIASFPLSLCLGKAKSSQSQLFLYSTLATKQQLLLEIDADMQKQWEVGSREKLYGDDGVGVERRGWRGTFLGLTTKGHRVRGLVEET